MIKSKHRLTMAVGVLALSQVLAHGTEAILSPVKRQEALERGKKLLAAREVVPVTVDPFYSEKFQEMVSGVSRTVSTGPVVAARRSERDILQAIAASLKPTGNFNVNGQQTLVFGQKRVKAGGFLTITFEGTEYTLEITAIERTSFSLRLNREEFTRPIK